MSRGIARIDRIVPRRSAEYGGKARGLAALVRGGFPVPSGYVISSKIAERHMASVLPDADLPAEIFAARDVPATRLADIRRRLIEAPLSLTFREDLDALFRELCLEGFEALVVRSSSTLEDVARATAAGMHTTVLNVRSEDALDEAVRRCWAGLYSDRAHAYLRTRHERLIPQMGLIIQAQVPADAGGVMMTVNPLTGDAGELVIDASYGLGQSVASGEVSPDTYRIDKATRGYRDRVIGAKAQELLPSDDGALVYQPVDRARSEVLCLSESTVELLSDYALRLERHLGGPQDAEFVVQGDVVWLVQCRPLDVAVQPGTRRWARRRRAGSSDRRNIVWSNVNVGEALPGVATPLTWSVLSHFSELGFRRALGALGVSMSPESELVGGFRGRIYLNLSEMTRALAEVPGFRPSMIVALGGGGIEGLVELESRSSAGFLARLPFTLRRFVAENLRLLAEVQDFDREFAVEVRRHRAIDPRLLSPSGLEATLRDTERLLDRTGALMLTVYGNVLAASLALAFVLDAVAGDDATGLLRDLLGGIDDVASVEPGLELARVAATLRVDEAAAELIRRTPTHELTVEGLPTGPTKRALFAFLTRFGHRGPREAELAEPRWGEDPAAVFAALKVHLRRPWGLGVETTSARRERHRAATERRLRAEVSAPLRPLVRGIVSVAQRFMRLREHLRSHVTEVLGLTRRVALDASLRIATQEPSVGEGAAFFLTIDELHQFLRGELGELAPRIAQRRVQYERDRALPDPPYTFVGYPPPVVPAAAGRDVLRGISASAGVAEGRVRLLARAEDAEHFEPGDILVARVADVGWSPLFLAAAGVVTDLGGPLSHASIVLREYGIPAVVNAMDATSLLVEGERVRVDGFRGEVRRLDVPEAPRDA